MRALLAEFLEASGFAVIQAEDGAAAIAVVDSGADFDILFTDIQMPGPIDGVGVADLVRLKRPGAPIVLTSGQPPPTPMPPGMRFVSKPYNTKKIVALLHQLAAA